jgi:hypothetical protein
MSPPKHSFFTHGFIEEIPQVSSFISSSLFQAWLDSDDGRFLIETRENKDQIQLRYANLSCTPINVCLCRNENSQVWEVVSCFFDSGGDVLAQRIKELRQSLGLPVHVFCGVCERPSLFVLLTEHQRSQLCAQCSSL